MHRLVKPAAIVCLTCTFGSASEVLKGQQSRPAFEVVSIRKSLEGGPSFGGTKGDTYSSTFTTALYLISWAYHDEIRDDQLVRGPDWLQADRFDITAKPAGVTINETRLKVQSLLDERFGLVIEKEPRPGGVYLLRVARGDATTWSGPGRVNDDCVNNKPKDPIALSKMLPHD